MCHCAGDYDKGGDIVSKNSGGEVTYELRGDDSKLEQDLDKANKKVEKSSEKSADKAVKIEEEKTEKLKKQSDKVVKNHEKAADDVADAWKDAGKDAEKALSKLDDDIEITVDADADTGKAEQKIEHVSKDKNIDVDVNADVSDAGSGIESLEDVAEKTGEKISEKLSESASVAGNLGGALKESLGAATESSLPLVGNIGKLTEGLSGAKVAALGAGVAAAGVVVAGVKGANDINSAMNQLTAATGATTEQSEKWRGVLESVYKNNYGEDYGDIADGIEQITKNLGDMDSEPLQSVTESAFALRDTFGYEIPESTRAAKAMMDNFGISGDQAMNLIAEGAQNGLDYSGELLDSISEYSVQFNKVGLGANDMFAIFQKGAESGAFNLDKVGDAVKEFSIRAIDGSDTTVDGFKKIGLNADEMAKKFSAGGDTAKEAFQQTIKGLAEMEDPIAQNTAGVDLFGTMWEDLGPEAVTAMADIQTSSYDTADAMNQIKDVKYDDLSSQFETLKRNVSTAIIPIGESLIPLLQTLANEVLPVVISFLIPLIQLFMALLSPIITLIGNAITPLISAFNKLVSNAITPLVQTLQSILVPMFTGSLNGVFNSASSVVRNIISIFRSLIDFIKNVFTGNWRGAWNNVRSIFSNAISGLAVIFKAPLNAIVDGWNSLARSLGSVSVPDWVPGVGGKSFSLPKMSRLKIGMDYVPCDMYPAYLDEGEWVLTKEEANILRSYGGLEGMIGMIDRNSSNVSVNVQNQNREFDYEKFGRAAADAMITAGIGFKCDEREFARLIKDLIDYV